MRDSDEEYSRWRRSLEQRPKQTPVKKEVKYCSPGGNLLSWMVTLPAALALWAIYEPSKFAEFKEGLNKNGKPVPELPVVEDKTWVEKVNKADPELTAEAEIETVTSPSIEMLR